MPKPMRVFEKDGDRVTTGVPAKAVELIARGYEEIFDDEPAYRAGGVVPSSGTRTVPKGTTVTRSPADERNSSPD